MRYGTHRQLEEEADRLLRESLRGVTSHLAKRDILTPWKEQERRRREVFVSSGVPDPAIRKGMFGRVANTRQTHLNARDGIAQVQAQVRESPSSATLADGGLAAFLDREGAA